MRRNTEKQRRLCSSTDAFADYRPNRKAKALVKRAFVSNVPIHVQAWDYFVRTSIASALLGTFETTSNSGSTSSVTLYCITSPRKSATSLSVKP